MPIFNNMLGGAAGSGGAAGYEIERSLRFDSGSGGYLSKNFGSAGNRKTWTASFWTKRCINNTSFYQSFLINRDNASYNLRIDPASASTTAYKFYFNFASGVNFTTTQVFRDPSAWMHVVVVYDSRATTTSTDRLKLYINGERVTAFDAINYPGDDVLSEFNNSNNYGIGYFNANTALDGYLADYHFIDGQALAESDFGEYDDNGVWQPKAYSGTYGTNGFHLDFSDNSNNDALGYDANGTVRYWPDVTGTNISSTVKNLFDGSTTTAVDGTAGTTITFTPSTPIPYSSSVEVYTASGATERTYSLNGGTGVTNVANGWTSLATGSGTITSISNTPNSNYYQSWSAIRVDGVILTDPNDWTVNNLTANRSEPYAHMWSGTFLAGEPGENAFDGSTITAARPDSSQTITWTHPTGIPFTQLSMRAAKSGAGTNITVNGVDVTETFNPQTTADLSSVITSPLTTISLTSTASERPKLMYVAIDGTALVSGHNTDVFIDSPTNYEADSGNNGGNYCTWNPLVPTSGNFNNGNLEMQGANAWRQTTGTIAVSSGKWYYEATYKGNQWGSTTANSVAGIGFYKADVATNTNGVGNSSTYNNVLAFIQTGYFANFAAQTSIRTQIADGDVIGVSVDLDAGTYAFYINGSSLTSGNLAYTGPLTPWTKSYYNNSTGYFVCNFGQRPFAYAPPTGYVSLCTQNLDDPTIEDPSTAFDIALWSGDGAARNIPTSMSPDLVWIKKRNSATFGNHQLFDAVRQATYALVPNDSQGENEETTQLTAFNTDGFSLGASTFVNATGNTYVGWAWDAGTSNTDLTAVYNQNQSWSGYMLTPSGGYGNPKEKAFNAQSYNYAETANNGETLDFNSVTGLTASTDVFVLPENTANVSYTVTADIGGTTYTDSSVGQTGVTFSHTGNVTRITVRNNDSNSPTRLTHIKVDSKELIDQNIAVTQPTLDSTYRANTSAGLSIVSYTGNGASSAVIGHGLNAAPKMIMVKNRDVGDHGAVYHVGTDATNPQNYFLKLFAATSDGTASRSDVGAMWNDTAPTSSVFSVGTEDNVNASTENYIAYCWTSVEGYSAFGSYVGNGSADGPFIYTGFKVGWLMVKNSTTSNETWTIHDSTRDVDNPAEHRLLPSSDGGETTGTSPRYKDLLSNGFKIRGTSGEQNTSGNVYVYAAFAENPFKTARAR
jgi:hypothetical protein